ncbi:hypothetical protein [Lactobacillus helveticus]|nr:hypothetical protein [Lactobacillus helveticus]
MSFDANDAAAWFGAITGGISLGFQFYQEFRGKIEISLNPGNTSSYSNCY